MTTERWLTPTDRHLLSVLAETANLVRAARAAGISRDRAVYRLKRLRRLYGKPAAIGHRGRGKAGSTTLTSFGRRLAHPGERNHSATNRWPGTFRPHPSPHVDLGDGRSIAVTFRAHPSEHVTVEVDPESFVIARRRFESSARNVLRVRLEAIRPLDSGRVMAEARWGDLPVRAVLTPASVKRLRLARGEPAFFYLKAVAVRKG